MADTLYEGYEEWQSWSADAFMKPEEGAWRHYAAELRGIPLADQDVLEIGFGNGGFLGWARDQGARLHGTEISPRAVALAERNGVVVLPPDLALAVPAHVGRFALIAAFDVLEHLSRAQIDAFMDHVAQMLRPGGHFVARFPNGQSPFGAARQYADATHITVLSAPIFGQLIRDKPFAIRRAGDTQPLVYGTVPVRLGRRARRLARRGAEFAMKRLFGIEAPFGTDTLVLLERR